MDMKNCEFWFVVGSQFLYGPEVLETVDKRAAEMAETLNASGNLPCKVVYKATVKTDAEITQVMLDANHDDNCCGVITWCHTFSPSKMWIHGFGLLQKPYCHLATQYGRKIPNEEIDMDYMNLNQSAHGDREHGFIGARMRMPRKVIAGYWQDKPVQDELASWMRSAVGYAFSHKLRIVRFGDNMRDVAVTEGDKVEAQIKLGWQVDYWPVGHLVETMDAVTEAEIDGQMAQYKDRYDFATDDMDTVRYQAKEEAAMRKILEREGAQAFINNFQDLYGMEQLPGLASQNMMADGIGYGGEGDWKVAGMTAIMKQMAQGLEGGTLFMEDYTYDLEPGQEVSRPHAGGVPLHRRQPAPHRGPRPGHRRPPAPRPSGVRGPGGPRHRGLPHRHGRPDAPDHPGHPGHQAHPGHAQPARGPGHVEARPRPAHRRQVLDPRRRRPPHRPVHRRHRGDDGGLGRDDADRVRPHHQGHQGGGVQEGTVLQRHCLEAEKPVTWKQAAGEGRPSPAA